MKNYTTEFKTLYTVKLNKTLSFLVALLVCFTFLEKVNAQTPTNAATLAAQASAQVAALLVQAQQSAAQAAQSATQAQTAANLATGEEQALAQEAANSAQKASNYAQEYLSIANKASQAAIEYSNNSIVCANQFVLFQNDKHAECAIESYKRTLDQLQMANIAYSNCKEQAFAAAEAALAAAQYKIHINFTITNNGCDGESLGNIVANITGGIPPYHIEWSTGDVDVSSITNLKSEFYSCYVWDDYHHNSKEGVYVGEPKRLGVKFDPLGYSNGYNTSCYYCTDGVINVQVYGGQAPYTYIWNDGSTSQNRTSLAPKTYQLEITDAAGCKLQNEITLVPPMNKGWQDDGNSNATSASFIGTTNIIPLQFKAGNNLGFTLMPNTDALFTGKIGIGTTAPVEKFELAGGNAKFGADVRINGNLTLTALPQASTTPSTLLTQLANGNLATLNLSAITERINDPCPQYGAVPELLIDIADDGSVSSTPSTVQSFALTSAPFWKALQNSATSYKNALQTCTNVLIGYTAPHQFSTNLTSNLEVNGGGYFSGLVNAQKVGIGTLTPTDKLEIKNGALSFNVTNPNAIPSWIGGWKPIVKLPIGSCISTSDVTAGADASTPNLRLGFGMTNSGWYFIRDNNNLNAAASYNGGKLYAAQLSTEGVFTCRKVVIDLTTNWNDIVFESNYYLTPLSDVEKFINLNKHLPEVPSAAELKSTGIDTESMLSAQMKKIEELTLYLIQQQKEIEALKAKLK